ncbi:MAG: hypothetical protein ACKVS9_02990 [Phycisphaerae bacterium]
MSFTNKWLCVSACLVAAPLAPAEVLSFTGFATTTINEIVNGAAGKSDSDSGSHPASALPIQVVSRVTSDDLLNPSAGAVAAQFADPTALSSLNPEEFAINLTLNSVTPSIRYQATAETSETRRVVFNPGDLGLFSRTGEQRRVSGRLYLDGALAIISVIEGRDLTGANVTLKASIVKRADGAADQVVFDGAITMTGAANNTTGLSVEGAFPTRRLILTDLSIFQPNFEVFQVLILPNIAIDYAYNVVIGEEFELVATVKVDAQNVPDNVGVAAVIGTPIGTLSEVFAATRGQTVAADVVDTIQTERESPSGDLAFDDGLAALGGLCGAFGIESLLGFSLIGTALIRRRHA